MNKQFIIECEKLAERYQGMSEGEQVETLKSAKRLMTAEKYQALLSCLYVGMNFTVNKSKAIL